MTNKRKPTTKKRDPNQITAPRKSDEDRAVAIARMILRPEVQATATLKEYGKPSGDFDLFELYESLTEQTKAVKDGDLKRGEAMLTVQAHTLDAIFNNLAWRAALNIGEHMQVCDTYLKLALRAQSQCRATWETLSTIKNPPMAGYVGQANIAHGPQQVNNAPSSANQAPRARENENLQNELLEAKHGERLDARASGATSGNDPELATVGEIERAEDSKR